ncbi:MAG: phosphoribosyltransferase [Modestobacter sp.]|jgi:putative phosphoribosyl transferase|nr:phosphoribosyltransferase [Modestobacter sp.]MCW2676563.1 phosphoribosyltransferase [Modestobacter sp.]
MPFRDRADAGRQLARRVAHLRGADVVVLGLPRGGVPVAYEVATALDAPLDVVLVRKVRVPGRPELAMGAVGEGDVVVRNDHVLRLARVGAEEFAAAADREREELERRAQRVRVARPRLPLAGRTVLVVDDGIATGATARAAGAVVRAQGAARVVLAAPVCAPDAAMTLAGAVEELVCLEVPQGFVAVGQAYTHFRPTPDQTVLDLLCRAAGDRPAPSPGGTAPQGRDP